jgi:hypothetical protein
MPYYLSAPSVRAFVPLSPDGNGYALDEMVWFPLTRYASQLEAAGSLTCTAGTLTWAADSGPIPFQRRVRLSPSAGTKAEQQGKLLLKLDRAIGRRTLRFAYQTDASAAVSELPVEVWALRSGSPGRERLVLHPEESAKGLTAVELDCSDPDITALEVAFHQLPPDGVWIYELNLTADDFRP